MATVPARLTDRTPAARWAGVRDEDALWGDLRPELLEAVQRILEATMEDELAALLRAQPYERTHLRLDVRNGVYYRRLVTELGAITDLAVPRRRLVPYRPSFLRHAARRTTTVDGVLRRAFLRGLSTRETAALATTLTGVPLSAASVSRLARELDAQVAAFHRRSVAFAARYLLVDGLWVSVRSATRAQKRVVLAAYGIDEAGRRELLDYRQAASESAAEWRRLSPRSSPGASTPTRSSLSPPTGRAGSRRRSPRCFPRPPSSAAGHTACATCSRPCRSPSGSPACAGCARCTGPGHDGPRCRRTGAGPGPGVPVIPCSCAISSAISTTCSRCSPCPSRCGPACARPT